MLKKTIIISMLLLAIVSMSGVATAGEYTCGCSGGSVTVTCDPDCGVTCECGLDGMPTLSCN